MLKCLNLIQTIENAHEYEIIWYLAYHPILNIFASCGSDYNINIWKLSHNNQYEQISTLSQAHTKTIRAISWDPSGNYLAAASMDSKVSIWKMINDNNNIKFNCSYSLEGHEKEVKSVTWSISGKYLATCGRDKCIWIWDIDNIDICEFSCNTVLNGHTQDIKMVKWSPREDILFSCSFDETIKIWEYMDSEDDWVNVNTLNEHKGTVWCIDFNKDAKYFCSCSDDLSLIIWSIDYSIKHYKNIQIYLKFDNLHERSIYHCKYSIDNNYIYTCAGDNSICILQIDNNTVKLINKTNNAHKMDINCICGSKDNTIFTCSDDGSIKIWSIY